MRILIAMMKHETNTFSPIVTDMARFEEWGCFFGDAARQAYTGTAMPFAAYLNLADEIGAEVITPVAAEAMPGGRVTKEAYEHLSGAILNAAAKGNIDCAMLDLHGAMVTETTDDGEGTLLERIRQIAPQLPIAVTLDLHCNLTAKMVQNCTALIGYKTYPHVDMYEMGLQVGRILLRSMKGEIQPVMAWGQTPLLSQTLRQGTDDEPMKGLIELARAEEAEGALAATVFGGFALADIKDAGTSAIVIADDNVAQATVWRDRLLARAWQAREEFIYSHKPLSETLQQVKALPINGPIVLLDHADNTGSGGTQDVMTVIAEVLAQGLDDVAVAAVWDPQAVQIMQRAGVGASLTLPLGGKTDMPSLQEPGRPLEITGKVKAITDGEWIVHGPMYTGVKVRMGPTAVLDTGKMQIVITSRHHEPWDVGVFTSVGIQPQHKKYLLLKSRIHYRAGFASLAQATFALDGIGVTTSDNRLLKYVKVRRPIYPLDRINEPM